MTKSESKYFNTAILMDKAFLELLEKKDFEYITVKEICERAGVNRSTFYLHYETIADLLNEAVEYMQRQFSSYFQNESKLDIAKIPTAKMEELYLITPQYLYPYLKFVKDNGRLFKTAIEKSNVLGSNNHFDLMFKAVFSPIMDRYNVSEKKKPYLLAFYIEGIIAIIKLWLKSECAEPIEFISDMIIKCINQKPYADDEK